MVSVSAWEREAIGERTASVLQHKKREGQVFNHTPFGFLRDGATLLPLPDEQATVRRIFSARSEGQSLREIAAELNAGGIATKACGHWHASTVRNILTNGMHQAAAA